MQRKIARLTGASILATGATVLALGMGASSAMALDLNLGGLGNVSTGTASTDTGTATSGLVSGDLLSGATNLGTATDSAGNLVNVGKDANGDLVNLDTGDLLSSSTLTNFKPLPDLPDSALDGTNLLNDTDLLNGQDGNGGNGGDGGGTGTDHNTTTTNNNNNNGGGGTSGRDGRDGSSGSSGSNGSNGTSGSNGASGSNGVSGGTGASGASGASGVSGSSGQGGVVVTGSGAGTNGRGTSAASSATTSGTSTGKTGTGKTSTADDGTSTLGTGGDELNAAKSGHGAVFYLMWLIVAAALGGLIAWGAARLRRRHRDQMLRRRMAALARDMHNEEIRRPETADLR